MKQIAVICAKPNSNPGMQSVDLGCYAVLRRLGDVANARFYTFPHPERVMTPERLTMWRERAAQLPFNYVDGTGQEDAIYSSDLILFWGDFLHARYYHEELAELLVDAGLCESQTLALEFTRRCLLLSDAEDCVLRKVLSFGTSVISQSQTDYADELYVKSAERLYQGARRVWTRDVLSALKVCHLRGGYGQQSLGVDCAMLWRPDDLEMLPVGDWSATLPADERAGIFVGHRTHTARENQLAFALELCTRMDAAPEWIPWLALAPECDAVVSRHLETRKGHCLLGDLYAALSKYRFVVTDTYHLCLNAWRVGTPAICIGGIEPIERTTLSEKKKEILYSMYEGGDLYVSVDRLRDAPTRTAIAERVADTLRSRSFAQAIHNRMSAHRDVVERELLDEIQHVLALQ